MTINKVRFDDDAALAAFVKVLGAVPGLGAGGQAEVKGPPPPKPKSDLDIMDTARQAPACKDVDLSPLRAAIAITTSIEPLQKALADLRKPDQIEADLRTPAKAASIFLQNIIAAGDPSELASRFDEAWKAVPLPCKAELRNEGIDAALVAKQKPKLLWLAKSIPDIPALKVAVEDASDENSRALHEEHQIMLNPRFQGTVEVAVQTAEMSPAGGDPKYNDFAKATLRFGQHLFVLSGGMALSPIPRRDYQLLGVETQTPAGADGTCPAGSAASATSQTVCIVDQFKLARKSDFSWRATPMVLGSLNICRGCFIGAPAEPTVYLSFGLTVGDNSKGLNLEYLAGPSLGLFQSRLIVTAGVYFASVVNVVPGYIASTLLPTGSNPPTVNQLRRGLGFAISYGVFKR